MANEVPIFSVDLVWVSIQFDSVKAGGRGVEVVHYFKVEAIFSRTIIPYYTYQQCRQK
jgi:hypothetical protein